MGEIKGWIKLHKKVATHWLWSDKPFSKGQAFIDLVLKANHCDGEKMLKGLVVDYERGELLRSELTLAAEWGWSRGKVRRFLELLENNKMIGRRKIQATTIISICNYDDYQSRKDEDDTAGEQEADSQQAGSSTLLKNNNNKEKQEKDEALKKAVERVVSAYEGVKPPKFDKTRSAAKEWIARRLKEHSEDDLLMAVSNYKKICEQDNDDYQFRTGCRNFFNKSMMFDGYLPKNFTEPAPVQQPPQETIFPTY